MLITRLMGGKKNVLAGIHSLTMWINKNIYGGWAHFEATTPFTGSIPNYITAKKF